MLKRKNSQKEDEVPDLNLPQLLKFQEAEFLKLTENFSIRNAIEKGLFFTLYRGVLPSGRKITVKKLELLGSREKRAMIQKSFFTELHVLARIRHRNIQPVLGYFSNVDTMALILTFMPRGSLENKLSQRHTFICLDWTKRYRIALGVSEALSYLHHHCKHQVIHCQLNPANILLDDDHEPHLANFGSAKMVDREMRLVEGPSSILWCPGYTAPELLSGEKPTPAADVYSFGIVVLELLTRKSPRSVEFRGGVTLREWVRKALETGEWIGVLDPQLQQEIINQHEMLAVLEMGVSCCNELPQARPSMRTASSFLVRIRDHGCFSRFKKPISLLIEEKSFDWVSARKKTTNVIDQQKSGCYKAGL